MADSKIKIDYGSDTKTGCGHITITSTINGNAYSRVFTRDELASDRSEQDQHNIAIENARTNYRLRELEKQTDTEKKTAIEGATFKV